MASPYEPQLNQALAEYERQCARMAKLYDEFNGTSETMIAPQKVVRVDDEGLA